MSFLSRLLGRWEERSSDPADSRATVPAKPKITQNVTSIDTLIQEAHFAFPAEGDVLPNAEIHHNSYWQEHTQNLPSGFASAAQLGVAIRYTASGEPDPVYADMFNVGKNRPEQLVYHRPVSPGWYTILPMSGKYDIFLVNRSDRNIGATVYVDGEKASWAGVSPHSFKTIEGFEMTPSVVQEGSGNTSAAAKNVEDSKLGTIEIHFNEIARVETQVQKAPAHFNDPALTPKLVSEQKKSNLTFMSLTKAPPRNSYCTPGSIVNIWTPGALTTDYALPNGILRLNYRTTFWASQGAQWIAADDERTEQIDEYNQDPNPTNPELVVKSDSTDEPGAAQRRKRDEETDEYPQGHPNSKKRKTANIDPFEAASRSLDQSSSTADFFAAMATVTERDPDDYKEIVGSLVKGGIGNVQNMLWVSDADWTAKFLPHTLSGPAKRVLQTSIKDLLQKVSQHINVIDLT